MTLNICGFKSAALILENQMRFDDNCLLEFCSIPDKQGNYNAYTRPSSALEIGEYVYFSEAHPEVKVAGVERYGDAFHVEGYEGCEWNSLSEVLIITRCNNKQKDMDI